MFPAPFTESAEVFRCGWGLKVETYKKLKNKGTFLLLIHRPSIGKNSEISVKKYFISLSRIFLQAKINMLNCLPAQRRQPIPSKVIPQR